MELSLRLLSADELHLYLWDCIGLGGVIAVCVCVCVKATTVCIVETKHPNGAGWGGYIVTLLTPDRDERALLPPLLLISWPFLDTLWSKGQTEDAKMASKHYWQLLFCKHQNTIYDCSWRYVLLAFMCTLYVRLLLVCFYSRLLIRRPTSVRISHTASAWRTLVTLATWTRRMQPPWVTGTCYTWSLHFLPPHPFYFPTHFYHKGNYKLRFFSAGSKPRCNVVWAGVMLYGLV